MPAAASRIYSLPNTNRFSYLRLFHIQIFHNARYHIANHTYFFSAKKAYVIFRSQGPHQGQTFKFSENQKNDKSGCIISMFWGVDVPEYSYWKLEKESKTQIFVRKKKIQIYPLQFIWHSIIFLHHMLRDFHSVDDEEVCSEGGQDKSWVGKQSNPPNPPVDT